MALQLIEEEFEKPNRNEVIEVIVDKSVDESQYCICKLSTGGTMIFCCNTKCARGSWFHFECLDIDEFDADEGNWFCSDECKEEYSRKSKSKFKTSDRFCNIRNDYSKHLIWRGLNDLDRHDAVKENDGPRMIRHIISSVDMRSRALNTFSRALEKITSTHYNISSTRLINSDTRS